MTKKSITKANLEKFVLHSVSSVHSDFDPSLHALASVAAQTLLNENGGTVSVEPIAAEWARHPELKKVAAAARAEDGCTTTLALETIGKLAAARAVDENQRLALIQKLSSWTPESAENLELLIAEANQPELPLTFEQGWLRAANHYDNLPYKYEERVELAKRVWNFAVDSCLATAQPVAEELMDSLDALRCDYAQKMGDRKDAALLERFEAAWQQLDVLSIPYGALEPVIEVKSEFDGNVTTYHSETVLRVVPQKEAGRYLVVIKGKSSGT